MVDLGNLPSAYPLPYGEYLSEVEALHLILAHDLYNELKEIVSSLQGMGTAIATNNNGKEQPEDGGSGGATMTLTLLLMAVAFFTPLAGMLQPEKAARVHDYYAHKLQVRVLNFLKPLNAQLGGLAIVINDH